VARSAVSDEEIQLRKRARRRLVGAVALALLVVAAVPMILDSEPRQPPHRIEVQIPQMPSRPPAPLQSSMPERAQAAADAPAPQAAPAAQPEATENARAPTTAPSSAAAENAGTEANAGARLAVAPAGAAPQPRSDAAAASTGTTSPAPTAAKPASASSPAAATQGGGRAEKPAAPAGAERYAVALIATSSTEKAASLKRELQRLKFPAYTQRTPDGDKTRVRVGPYASREAAEQARQRLIRQGFDPGKVVRQGD
jgi:DedD protein